MGKRLTVIGKGNKIRVIDLEPFGGAAIFETLPEGIAKAPLFWHGKGERYENVASRFALFVREVAERDPDFVRFRFHDLRRLHAVEWLRPGRSTYDLQHRLGHSSIKTTEVYLKYLTPEEQLHAKGVLPAVPGTKNGTTDHMKKIQANEKAGVLARLVGFRMPFSKLPPSATRPRLLAARLLIDRSGLGQSWDVVRLQIITERRLNIETLWHGNRCSSAPHSP